MSSWELEIETEKDDSGDIHDFISELKNKFPETIKQIGLVTITDELKLEFFPEKLIFLLESPPKLYILQYLFLINETD